MKKEREKKIIEEMGVREKGEERDEKIEKREI